jgi:thiamine biosynthesis lipoprotein
MALFDRLDNQMSTWNRNSLISLFNTEDATAIELPDEFHDVIAFSLNLCDMTGGAFDITVKPLLDLWGFSAGKSFTGNPPAPELITVAQQKCGWKKLSIDHSSKYWLRKSHVDVQVELSATAKGYAVDLASELLYKKGYTNSLFEIGGEFCAKGVNPQGRPWRLGIKTPGLETSSSSLQGAVNVKNKGMATSGDYRNYFESGTNIYSHVIDPRTGYPASHGVASATVIAPSCMQADGLATSLMVLGVDDGLALINSLENTEAMIITRNGKSHYEHFFSSGFQSLMQAD